MHRLLLILSLAGAIALPSPSPLTAEPAPALAARSYPARVVSVTDGDTVKLTIDLGFGVEMREVPVRMESVFAPERGKPGGFEATAKLKELLPVGAPVIIRPEISGAGHEVMTFARYVCRIWRKDLDICAEMVRYLGVPQGGGAASAKP